MQPGLLSRRRRRSDNQILDWSSRIQARTLHDSATVPTIQPRTTSAPLKLSNEQPELSSLDKMEYNNACLTITNVTTPDPFVTLAHGKYYLTFTAGDRVEIWSSPDLLSFGQTSTKHVVWRPPPGTEYSGDLWAPELHEINGRWYIYVAAAHPEHGNKSHRMYVIGGPPSSSDPAMEGPWEFLGPIAGLPASQWQIDGTVISLNQRLYFVYSGWPLHNPNLSDLIQELFIVELANATQATSSPVQISQPLEPWERSGDHGINEGPQYLASPDASWIGIAYSCAGSWTKDYKMNTLQYIGGNPLNPQSWRKSMVPLIQARKRGGGPFGPGHGSFVNVDGETLSTYHATDKDNEGWDNRKARLQRVVWSPCGPEMGGEVGTLVPDATGFMMNGTINLSQRSEQSKYHGLRGLLHEAKDMLKQM